MTQSRLPKQAPASCRFSLKAYMCGHHASFVFAERQRDCSQCRELSQLSEQPVFCRPNSFTTSVEDQCERCDLRGATRGMILDNTNADNPEEERRSTAQIWGEGSETTDCGRTPCTAKTDHFTVCGCDDLVIPARHKDCPLCLHVSKASKEGGLCHPCPVRNDIEKMCNSCMLRIAQRSS